MRSIAASAAVSRCLCLAQGRMIANWEGEPRRSPPCARAAAPTTGSPPLVILCRQAGQFNIASSASPTSTRLV